MRRIFSGIGLMSAILAASAWAFAQQGLPATRWIHPGGGQSNGGRHGGAPAGSGGQANSTTPSGTPATAPANPMGFGGHRMPGGVSSGAVTDPSFAGRLGATVGLQALPPIAMPPGIGNINHPGMQPLAGPQPLPTGSPFPTPNINFPGGTPGMQGTPLQGWDGHGRRRFWNQYTGFGPIFYSVPYYIPVYTEIITTAPASSTPPPYRGPYDITVQPPAQPQTQQQPPAATPAPRPVTVLVFKDRTALLVTDYWLEGDTLVYETSPGMRTPVPLERLDLPLTQQLNRERNVRFILEARP